MKFKNRDHAGALLAKKLQKLMPFYPVILALPRGGIPVAQAIAEKLNAPLDVCFVKKIHAPGSEEFAIGAVAEDENPLLNEEYIKKHRLNRDAIADIISKRIGEIRKRAHLYRDKVAKIPLEGKVVALVDDGLATGASMKAAINWVRSQNVKKIIVAVPIASLEGAEDIQKECDEFVSLITSESMWAVGLWYEDFTQVSDAVVLARLQHRAAKAIRRPEEESKHRVEVTSSVEEEIQRLAHPFKSSRDLDEAIAEMAKHRIVMLGESTHGTKEFYQWRREISQILIRDHGFSFVAVEGDWPDCSQLTQLIQSEGESVRGAVKKSFHRWPTWMWSNEEIPPLIEWMTREKKGAFYGLDVYSLFESLDFIRDCAEDFEPEIARQLKDAYECFEQFGCNEIKYAESLLKIPVGCRPEILRTLREVLRIRVDDSPLSREKLFDLQQNARVVHNAEEYYRTMLQGGADSWNIRDRHMLETLERLLHFHGPNSRAIVWAHNTHIGDYHATDMLEDGYINLGGIARETFGVENVFLLGFGTYRGQVTAGGAWGSEVETMLLPQAQEGSWEDKCHKVSQAIRSDKYFLNFRNLDKTSPLHRKLGHRAVGVVYNPTLEKYGSNYVPTKLAQRYDGFIYIDVTEALRPIPSTWIVGEFPETYPSGQ